MLAAARAVIVDEIHAVAGNKRGSHLALTLERLEHLAAADGAAGDGVPGDGAAADQEPRALQRIGLSATQRPVEAVARLLVGAGYGRSPAARPPPAPNP